MSSPNYKKLFTAKELTEMETLRAGGISCKDIAPVYKATPRQVAQALAYYHRRLKLEGKGPAKNYQDYIEGKRIINGDIYHGTVVVETSEAKRERQLSFLKSKIK